MTAEIKTRKPAPKCRVNKHGEVVLTLSVEDAQYFRAAIGNTRGDEGYEAWDKLDAVCRNLPGFFRMGVTSGPFNTQSENRTYEQH